MFQIDPMSRIPVYEQIVTQAEKMISAGVLSPGDQLPSVRSLSMELSVNPNTIQRSYSALDNMGLVVSVPGKGCFVSSGARDTLSEMSRNRLSEIKALASELYTSGVCGDDIISAAMSGIKSAEERKTEK